MINVGKIFIPRPRKPKQVEISLSSDTKRAIEIHNKTSQEELDKVFMDYNLDVSKYIEEMQKKAKELEDRMVIDDIMAISSGKYKTYDDYLNSKMQIIKDAVEMNRNNMIVNSSCLKFTYYVQPSILSKDVFDYIVEQYGVKI